MQRIAITLAMVLSCLTTAHAQTLDCEGIGVFVVGGTPDLRASVCETATSSLALFDQCNILALSTDIRIEITDSLQADCVGVYHCGEHWIEVLSPSAIEETLDPDSIYSFMASSDYFHSVITHELSHAAYDAVPCPFETCVATTEYVAYAMQFLSIPPSSRATLETDIDWARQIHRDEINPIILYLAPDVFALKVWSHFNQQHDACGLVGQIMDGQYYFDQDLH